MIAASDWRVLFLLSLTQSSVPISWADAVPMSSSSPQTGEGMFSRRGLLLPKRV